MSEEAARQKRQDEAAWQERQDEEEREDRRAEIAYENFMIKAEQDLRQCEARIAELETENAALKAEISKLKAPQGWIDVKKQMPDVPIALVAWKDGSIKLDSTFTDGGRDYWYHSGLDNVAYWMPIPEPPIVYGKVCEE